MKRKILSALLVVALALGCIFSLTACKMADVDYTKAVSEIAKTYYAEHKDYKTFADTTIAISTTTSDQYYSSIVDGAIDKEDLTGTGKYSFKRAGEALLVYADVSANVVETVNYNDYTTGEPVAKVKTVSTVSTMKIETFTSVEGENTYYYIAAVMTSKVDDSIDATDGETITEKIYARYVDVEDYEDIIEDLINDANSIVSYAFTTSMPYYLNTNRDTGAEIEIDKKGEDIKYVLTYNGINTGSKLYETTQNLTVDFVGNKVSKMAQDYTYKKGDLVDTDKTEVIITEGAELTGTATKATVEAEYEYDYYGQLQYMLDMDVDLYLVPGLD